LVLMVKKPKDEEAPKPKTPTQQQQQASSAPAQASQPAQPSVPASTPEQAPSSAPTPSVPATPSSSPMVDPISGQNVESMISQLTDMGFPADQVQLALRASFFNMDRAVEYLTNGIPPGVIPSIAQVNPGVPAPAPAHAPAPAPRAAPAPASGGLQLPANLIPPGLAQQANASPLDARNNPMFPLLQQIAREDPNRLTEFLAQLAQTNPDLLRVIVQHRDEFIRMLSGVEGGGAGGGSGSGAGAGGAGAGGAGRQHTITVTPEDQAKITNIISITGMARERVMEAYFLFDKDEAMAINYLLNNPEDS